MIVSSLLFRFNRLALINNKRRFKKMFKLFEQKENDPSSLSVIHMLNTFELNEADSYRNRLCIHYRKFLNYTDKIENSFVVKYEDFIDNNTPELQEYLGLKVEKPSKLDGWLGKVNRKGASGDRRHWMLEEDVEFFSSELNGILKRMNYDTDWSLADPQIISKEHCSQYIVRLAEARKMDPNIKSPSKVSFEFLSSAAKDGKPKSVFKLGLMYLQGEECEKDLNEAEKLLTKAKDLNHSGAVFWLGECLRQQRKLQKAIHYFELAGQDGFSRGYLKLGLMYQNNRKLRDPEISRSYFEKGALLGDKKCQKKLLKLSK